MHRPAIGARRRPGSTDQGKGLSRDRRGATMRILCSAVQHVAVVDRQQDLEDLSLAVIPAEGHWDIRVSGSHCLPDRIRPAPRVLGPTSESAE